tara:strand:+ start:355 stop:654 length:300 start_codon:yes stop_codon:yes gene_type:complete
MSHNPNKLTEEGWEAFRNALNERYIKPMTNIVVVCRETDTIDREYSVQVTEEELQRLNNKTLTLQNLDPNMFEYLEDNDKDIQTEDSIPYRFFIEDEDA